MVNADQSISVTVTIKDSLNVVLLGPTTSTIYPGSPATRAADIIKDALVAVLNKQFTGADIPASFSIQYGFPATVRPIDLII